MLSEKSSYFCFQKPPGENLCGRNNSFPPVMSAWHTQLTSQGGNENTRTAKKLESLNTIYIFQYEII